MKTILAAAAGVGAGALFCWTPFGYTVMAVFAALTLIYFVRHTFDKKFSGSDKDSLQATFFFLFWITAATFYIRPTGLDTRLPVMQEHNVKVGTLIERWEGETHGIKIGCDKTVANKRITISTIAKITVGEALEMIAEKADAEYSFEQDSHGRSIAGGPRIDVSIRAKKHHSGGTFPGTDYIGPD